MAQGYVVISRDSSDSGVYIETTDDLEEYMEEHPDRRLLYCQAVSDVETVEDEVTQCLEDNEDIDKTHPDINNQIASIISSIQWIANDHPLRGFRSTVR